MIPIALLILILVFLGASARNPRATKRFKRRYKKNDKDAGV